MKSFLLYLYVFLHTNFCGCGSDHRKTNAEKLKKFFTIEQVGKLPVQLSECSGLVPTNRGTYFTLNDGGSLPVLYEISHTGELLETHELPTLRNRDWEDLARDDQGHIYIGDFGNNQNLRRDLIIYKLRETDLSLAGEIRFRYADQTAFPPPSANRNFDCEAFLWHQGQLHLFSKDRSPKRHTKHYTLPDTPGTHTATLTDSLRLNAHITAAAISPDKETMALLAYGKVYFFPVQESSLFAADGHGCLSFALSAQAEALCFTKNTELLLANEQGRLYQLRKK